MKFKRTLGIKIGLCFLLISILPLIISSILSSIQVRRNTTDIIKGDLSELVYQVGGEVERAVFYAYTHIKSLADNPIIKSESAGTEEKLLEMQKISDFFKVFEDITLINTDGVVIASTTYEYRGKWKYKDWFKQAKQGKAVVSPVHAILNPFQLVIVTTAPVIGKDGSVKEVVAGRINMRIIWDIVDRIKIGKTGFVFLIDKSGEIIAFPQRDKLLCKLTPENLRKEILSNQSGTIEYKSDDGKDKFCFYSILKGYGEYKGQGWRIAITQDAKEIYAVINKIQGQILLVAGGCFLFVLLLTSLLTRNIVRPIKNLAAATEIIAKGDLSTQVTVTTEDEIGDLGNSFNRMLDDLKITTVSRDYIENIIRSMIDPLIVANPDGVISMLNQAVLDLLGYRTEPGRDLVIYPDEFLNKKINQVFPEEFAVQIMSYIRQSAQSGETHIFEYNFLRLKDGMRNLEIRCSVIGENEVLVVIRDITEQKRAEQKLKQTLMEEHALALTDDLTKLYNRRGFLTLAHQQINISNRYNEKMLLFFIDLDNMKWINDSLGHEQGDKALIEIAEILKGTFRKSDIIARIGGDEFAVLMIKISDISPNVLITRLQKNVEMYNIRDPISYKRSISIGMSYYDPEQPCSVEELLARADKMMYEQKRDKQKS